MVSDTLEKQRDSGRRVKHSRNGCLTCKKRKLRCPENKPVCSRCHKDNKSCSYGILLQWEDDSRKRGIKHGRTTRSVHAGFLVSESSILLSFPSGEGGKHFLNTFVSDLKGDAPLAIVEGLDFERGTAWKAGPLLYTSPTQIPVMRTVNERDSTNNSLLFDYYDKYLSHSIPLLDSSTNLFRTLVLPVAATSEPVTHIMLALSALSLGTTTGKAHFHPIALRHKQHSMRLIREQIASNAIAAANDATVIVILMLCIFEISDNCQVSWATHLSAALDLMRLARSNPSDSASARINPEVDEFVSRFFLVKDALGRSACGKVAKLKHEIKPLESIQIDPSIGCSYELVGIISRITDLALDMRNLEIDKDAWQKETCDLERKLNMLRQHLPPTSSQLPGHISQTVPPVTEIEDLHSTAPRASTHLDETAILYNTSLLMQTSAKLYFHAKLRSLNPYSARARTLIEQIIGYTKQLSPNHLRSAHLWPLFVGAVYSTGDDEERVWFLNQFDILNTEQRALIARGALKRVKEILESVWKRRDLDQNFEVTGTYISPNIQQGGRVMEVGDWEKYVQPLSDGLSL